MRTSAPMTMRMAWMKSVQMTAESPPKMVKKAARASRMRMDVYSRGALNWVYEPNQKWHPPMGCSLIP